jgi:hypothetical protein
VRLERIVEWKIDLEGRLLLVTDDGTIAVAVLGDARSTPEVAALSELALFLRSDRAGEVRYAIDRRTRPLLVGGASIAAGLLAALGLLFLEVTARISADVGSGTFSLSRGGLLLGVSRVGSLADLRDVDLDERGDRARLVLGIDGDTVVWPARRIARQDAETIRRRLVELARRVHERRGSSPRYR